MKEQVSRNAKLKSEQEFLDYANEKVKSGQSSNANTVAKDILSSDFEKLKDSISRNRVKLEESRELYEEANSKGLIHENLKPQWENFFSQFETSTPSVPEQPSAIAEESKPEQKQREVTGKEKEKALLQKTIDEAFEGISFGKWQEKLNNIDNEIDRSKNRISLGTDRVFNPSLGYDREQSLQKERRQLTEDIEGVKQWANKELDPNASLPRKIASDFNYLTQLGAFASVEERSQSIRDIHQKLFLELNPEQPSAIAEPSERGKVFASRVLSSDNPARTLVNLVGSPEMDIQSLNSFLSELANDKQFELRIEQEYVTPNTSGSDILTNRVIRFKDPKSGRILRGIISDSGEPKGGNSIQNRYTLTTSRLPDGDKREEIVQTLVKVSPDGRAGSIKEHYRSAKVVETLSSIPTITPNSLNQPSAIVSPNLVSKATQPNVTTPIPAQNVEELKVKANNVLMGDQDKVEGLVQLALSGNIYAKEALESETISLSDLADTREKLSQETYNLERKNREVEWEIKRFRSDFDFDSLDNNLSMEDKLKQFEEIAKEKEVELRKEKGVLHLAEQIDELREKMNDIDELNAYIPPTDDNIRYYELQALTASDAVLNYPGIHHKTRELIAKEMENLLKIEGNYELIAMQESFQRELENSNLSDEEKEAKLDEFSQQNDPVYSSWLSLKNKWKEKLKNKFTVTASFVNDQFDRFYDGLSLRSFLISKQKILQKNTIFQFYR